MLTRTESRSKRIAMTLVAALITAMPSWAGVGNGDAANTASLEATGPRPIANRGSVEPASPLAAELEELRASIQAQAQQFAEHSKELESERAALNDELQRIVALEAKLGITPKAAEEILPP